MAHSMPQQMSQEMQDCIDNCQDCHSLCLETITYCLQTGGKHSEPSHIRLLMDCAQICDTSADYMLRMSDLHPSSCALCAEVCDACAQDCDSFKNDQVMKSCADLCRKCGDSCRQMAGMSSTSGRRRAAA